MKKLSRNQLLTYSALLLILILLILANAFSYFSSSMSDRLYREQNTLDNIIILKIDDESINKIGRWPWGRNVFSELLQEVKDAKVIGVDVSFFEPSEDDSSLKETLDSMDNVVLATEINQNTLLKPIFETDYGYVNLATDSDGITRSVQYGLEEGTKPFAFEVYQKSIGVEKMFEDKIYLINYASNPDSFSSISVYDVLQNNSAVDFKNKIVLIGATAPDLHDNYFVPTSEGIAMPGVEIHANIIQNLILGNFLNKQEKTSLLLLTILASLLGFFVLSRLKVYYTIPSVLLIIFLYALLGIYVFNNFNYLLDLFFVPISLWVFTAGGIAVNYLEEKKHSAYLTEAFGKYISKDLLGEIITKKQQLELGGAKRTITVFFSDIRGFTSISEKLSPEDLVQLINDYLTAMTKIILDHNGTVDKFIGDAVMAFWNAPLIEEKHAELACKSAIAQIKALEKLRKFWEEKGYPKIEIGCGIHTGKAIIGNMGSEDRFDYTAMGDAVNLSSRLEGLTKQYGVNIIISEDTKKLLGKDFTFRELDYVKVKGKKIPITIYELCIESDGKFIRQYERALKLYFKMKFREARKEFEKASKMKKDKASEMFIERCEQYIQSPPKKDWDGAWVMKTK